LIHHPQPSDHPHTATQDMNHHNVSAAFVLQLRPHPSRSRQRCLQVAITYSSPVSEAYGGLCQAAFAETDAVLSRTVQKEPAKDMSSNLGSVKNGHSWDHWRPSLARHKYLSICCYGTASFPCFLSPEFFFSSKAISTISFKTSLFCYSRHIHSCPSSYTQSLHSWALQARMAQAEKPDLDTLLRAIGLDKNTRTCISTSQYDCGERENQISRESRMSGLARLRELSSRCRRISGDGDKWYIWGEP
jgi:hypothetical protein